jgi:YVTN family beta-propeller protein
LTNTASNTISIIDTEKREVMGEITTGNGPARIALTPDEKTLVYNLQPGEGVGFADVQARKQTGEVKIPGRPLSLSLSRDGRTAYLGLQDSDKIAIVSVPERKVARIIDTPSGAGPDTVAPLL